jgi:hypothetical protein
MIYAPKYCIINKIMKGSYAELHGFHINDRLLSIGGELFLNRNRSQPYYIPPGKEDSFKMTQEYSTYAQEILDKCLQQMSDQISNGNGTFIIIERENKSIGTEKNPEVL